MDGEVWIYIFEVVDEVGNVGIILLDIIVVDFIILIDVILIGVFFNQVGFIGIGGFNFDNGEGIGSVDVEVEICDFGLDCIVLVFGLNWCCQIGIVNGVDMVKVDEIQVENFIFDNVFVKEEIEVVYVIGVELSDGVFWNCVIGIDILVIDVMDELVVGDMFVVLANGIYYLICIDVINEIDDSNVDNYELFIKY